MAATTAQQIIVRHKTEQPNDRLIYYVPDGATFIVDHKT